MAVLERIAFFQNRRDEVPNQQLARELAQAKDVEGIREIAENLWNSQTNIASDCLKVLYEIGYLDPELIADYCTDFIRLLKSRNNRMVWGSMIALSTIAVLKADEIYLEHERIEQVIETGSVITQDNGIKTLAAVAAQKEEYRRVLLPYLLAHLQTCRPKDIPQHAESISPAIDEQNRLEFIKVLEKRSEDLSITQAARIKKLLFPNPARK